MGSPLDAAKQTSDFAFGRLQRNLAAVPDDKLCWSPTPTAKSALRIGAHVAIANRMFLPLFQMEPLPKMTMPEVLAVVAAEEQKFTSREQVVDALNESYANVIAAAEKLTPEQLTTVVSAPMMDAPLFMFIHLIGIHMHNHAGQIDYLQTCWGDLELHM